jgi:type II restriction/modification system DNA methylase subunit YeeA
MKNKCAALDRQIDALVYELYDLTADEIKIVEGVAK